MLAASEFYQYRPIAFETPRNFHPGEKNSLDRPRRPRVGFGNIGPGPSPLEVFE